MRERVQTLADELLDRVMYDGEMDLIKDYALPLAMVFLLTGSDRVGQPG
ncbi:MAG TPA: hypothetical protein VEW46_26490 [Pyrinomonadaceae bacterium]|nr:hypothetical protein [Pyrinomonadaceae bacterium]